MFAQPRRLPTIVATVVSAVVITVALASPRTRADEPEFQVVGTVEAQRLSLTILPRPGYRLGAETPVLVHVDSADVELPRKQYRREDAVDPRAEAPRFEIAFRRPAPLPSAKVARIDAELTFYVCRAARCRPIVTRYTTTL